MRTFRLVLVLLVGDIAGFATAVIAAVALILLVAN